MGFLLDIFKIVLAKETEEKASKLIANNFLERTKAKLRQHLKLKTFNLESFFKKFNIKERQSLEQYLQNLNLKDILLEQFEKYKNNLQSKYKLSNQGFGQILQIHNELKAGNNLINKSPAIYKNSSQAQKSTASKRPEPKFNIKFNMISEAIQWGVFIPTLRERTEYNKYANFKGIVKIKFRKNNKVYDYYNINWNLFERMLGAQGPIGAHGAWSVYLDSQGFKKRTQAQIKKYFKIISSPKQTKSRRYIRTATKIPSIKGINKVKKGG